MTKRASSVTEESNLVGGGGGSKRRVWDALRQPKPSDPRGWARAAEIIRRIFFFFFFFFEV